VNQNHKAGQLSRRKREVTSPVPPPPAEQRSPCPPGECMCTEIILGNVFTIYRCVRCGAEEWL
jgi:hypothetical protein